MATLVHARRSRRRPIARRMRGAAKRTGDRVRDYLEAQRWWETTLIVVGFVTIVTVFGSLILGLDDKPDEVTLTGEIGPVGSREFLSTVSRLSGAAVEHGGDVTLLDNGDEFLPALLDAIRQARATINFSVFMWDDGAFSDQVLAALLERQRQGVQVRVLLDTFGAISAPDSAFEPLKAAGGLVGKYRTPAIGSWTRVHRRNHRRAIVIDGRVGFTGGIAVKDTWLGHAQSPDYWRDVMFKVTGPMAASLQGAFADTWASAAAEILVGPQMFPDQAGAATGTARPFIHLINSPAPDDHSMAYFYLLPVLAARERISIVTPYFIPDDPLKRALMDQARKGVDVRLLLPGAHIDNPLNRWSSQTDYHDLLGAGVRIFEYQPTFIHSKVAIFDSRWSVFGSPNLNSRSRTLDEENVFGVLDESLGRELEEMFVTDLGKAREITLEEWRKRSVFARLLQWISTILDEQS